MILVNLANEPHKREVDPLERVRGLFALALPFFAIVVAIAAWPDKTVLVRQATLEEKETVVELLGRLPSYYERLEKISASIVDEIAFDRAELKVRVEPAPTVQFDDTSMTVTEGFLHADPRSQAQALSSAIAPHEAKALPTDIAVRGE